jgi:uncharacterized protein (TIGR02117 family)
MHRLGRWPAILAALVFSWSPADGAAAMPAAPVPARGDIVYVIAESWHTELALPVAEISGALAPLMAAFPGAPYLIFGWGARDYYMARNPGLGDLLRAAVPGPAVMLVIPLGVRPTAYLGPGNAWAIPLSREGAADLPQFLWDSVAKNRVGIPLRVGDGPYPRSVFYAAKGTYDASNTCNTWTAEALHAAGLPVTAAGVVFAGQLVDQLPPLTVAAKNGSGAR